MGTELVVVQDEGGEVRQAIEGAEVTREGGRVRENTKVVLMVRSYSYYPCCWATPTCHSHQVTPIKPLPPPVSSTFSHT